MIGIWEVEGHRFSSFAVLWAQDIKRKVKLEALGALAEYLKLFFFFNLDTELFSPNYKCNDSFWAGILPAVLFDPAKTTAFPEPEYVKGKMMLNIMRIMLAYAKCPHALHDNLEDTNITNMVLIQI